MLILYPATLLNLFIGTNSFFVKSFGVFYLQNMSSTNTGNFTSSFTVQILFISFSCLIALAVTSRMMLNRNESEHHCLVPNFREISDLFICICWTMPASQGWIPLDHGILYFYCTVEFVVLIFCWEWLHLYLSRILAYSFLFLVVSLSGFGIRIMLAL